jgi:hypothetical protein
MTEESFHKNTSSLAMIRIEYLQWVWRANGAANLLSVGDESILVFVRELEHLCLLNNVGLFCSNFKN